MEQGREGVREEGESVSVGDVESEEESRRSFQNQARCLLRTTAHNSFARALSSNHQFWVPSQPPPPPPPLRYPARVQFKDPRAQQPQCRPSHEASAHARLWRRGGREREGMEGSVYQNENLKSTPRQEQ